MALAAEAEQLPEGRPLEQIPQGVEQCCVGAEQILELGLEPPAHHTSFKCRIAALLDQLAQPLSQIVIGGVGQVARNQEGKEEPTGRFRSAQRGWSTWPNSLLVISGGVVRVSTVKRRLSVWTSPLG